MGFKKHLLNGIVSLIISVVVTVVSDSGEDGSYSLTDVVLAVATSAFLSGLFTSYFASK
ncbi:MAG: hypothetical protein ABEH61_04780 [Haloarculaceae archaeon]